MKDKKVIFKVLKAVLTKGKMLNFGIIISVTGTIAVGIIPPLVLESIINDLTGRHSVTTTIICLYFILIVISGLFDALKEVLITIFGQRVTKELRHKMCEKLSRLPALYFSEHESGVITSLFVNDVDTVDTLFASGVISMFVDSCKIISILVVIAVKSSGLGILMLLITPPLYMYTRYVQRKMYAAQLDNRASVAKSNNHIPETIENIRMIHVFKKEKYMEDKYDSYIQRGYKSMEQNNLYDAVYSPVILVISAVIISVMMILAAMGGQMQSFFGMSVGTAVAVIAYVGKVFDPLESIGMEIQNIQSAAAGVHRIINFLNEKEINNYDDINSTHYIKEVNSVFNITNCTSVPAVEINNVSFGYNNNQMILQNLNMQVQQGDSITLAGRTGAGKSTIIKLILGLIYPDSGQVKVFGIDSDKIPNIKKRKLFGYVEQSFKMVSGTVAEQISLYDPELTKEDIIYAAELVGLHERIMQLENNYDTIYSPSLFSQGQLQLLSIARAVVSKPSILLLDEITANLDSETEHLVMEALTQAAKNRTVISVSHRLYNSEKKNIIMI